MKIFLATTLYNMEKSLFLDTLEAMGHEVIHHGWKFEDTYTQGWLNGQKSKTNIQMLDRLLTAHKSKPVDLFLGYLSNRTASTGVLAQIRQVGIPMVNFSWDDKLKVHMQAEIAKYFDLCWTTDKTVFKDKGNYWQEINSVKAYKQRGAKAIYLPAGANPGLFKPPAGTVKKKYSISFVGSGGGGYGYRDKILTQLKKDFGDKLHLFGSIANNKVSTQEYINIIHQSQIVLGFSGSAGAEEICSPFSCIKGRDFEVPMAGGFYLTEHIPELENIFEIGAEIATYRSYADLEAKLRHYLNNPEQAQRIALRGCERARKDHTMQRRFEVIFRELGLS